MKKIISVLVSLLLMASVFGVSPAFSDLDCCDDTNYQIRIGDEIYDGAPISQGTNIEVFHPQECTVSEYPGETTQKGTGQVEDEHYTFFQAEIPGIVYLDFFSCTDGPVVRISFMPPETIKQCDLDSPCKEINYQFSRAHVQVGQILTYTEKFTIDEHGEEVLPNFWLVGIIDYKFQDGKEFFESVFLGYTMPNGLGYFEFVSDEIYSEDGTPVNGFLEEGDYRYVLKFRAVKPGTVDFILLCVTDTLLSADCYKMVPVTITPRSLPMHSIMKILGIGGLMRE